MKFLQILKSEYAKTGGIFSSRFYLGNLVRGVFRKVFKKLMKKYEITIFEGKSQITKYENRFKNTVLQEKPKASSIRYIAFP